MQRQTEEAEQRRTERERESLESVIPAVHIFAPTLLFLFFLTYSICSNVHIRNQ